MMQPEVVRLYESGMSGAAVGNLAGISETTVYRIMRRNGLRQRTRQEVTRGYTLRHSAFDVLTPEACYWAGFLFADGCIWNDPRPGRGPQLILALAAKDRHHLRAFRRFLGSNHKLVVRRRNTNGREHLMVHFAVTSRRLCEKLGEYGMTSKPRIVRSEELVLSRDFWRGE